MRVKAMTAASPTTSTAATSPHACQVSMPPNDVVNTACNIANFATKPESGGKPAISRTQQTNAEAEKRHRRGNRDADFVLGRVRIGRLFHAEPEVGTSGSGAISAASRRRRSACARSCRSA